MFALGPYHNAQHGPKDCPWGGPTEGDDDDYFFLTRGDEERSFVGSVWKYEDRKDWKWRMAADSAAKQRRLHYSMKRNQRTHISYDVTGPISPMRRSGTFLKTKHEVADAETKKKKKEKKEKNKERKKDK